MPGAQREKERHRKASEWVRSADEDLRLARHGLAHLDTIRDVVSRLGLADVRAFELTWEDCEAMLRRLGFTVHLEIIAA